MKKKALLVGIDDYPSSPLRGCLNDAERLHKILSGEHCEFECRVLLNNAATRASVRKSISWALSDCDVTVVYFAGHGWRRPTGTYLVTHDAQEDDEGIDISWLSAAATRLTKAAQTVIFLLDCCHSGDATARGSNSVDSIRSIDITAVPGIGRVVIAACRGDEVALEYEFNGMPHGAFTHFLCEAITGGASDRDGSVTLNATYDYIVSQLKERNRQTPVMKGDQEGTFVFASNVKKIGSWTLTEKNQLSVEEACSRAENHLTSIHQMFSMEDSFSGWNGRGYAAACRAFEPVLNWFRRRSEIQPELLRVEQFKRSSETCNHFLSKLCNFNPGTRLVNGLVSRRIGSGSFGCVWKIEESSWSEPVCFKSFHPQDLLDKEKVYRFRRGYEAMKQLDHPNIVKVLQLNELPFGFYMQYVDGANLRDLNPGTSSDPGQIIDMLTGVAETLKHAHGRGVIHRDVKPENILMMFKDSAYEPYLTDFDLAWFSAATQITTIGGFGSQYYAAPEQVDSPQAALTHLATVDSYSFGQLCFFSVCGHDPMAFNRDGNARALEAKLSKIWTDMDASSQMLKLFVECTAMQPRARVNDFREICERLRLIKAMLSNSEEAFDSRKFLDQLRFNLGGGLKSPPTVNLTSTLISRAGRTEILLALVKDAVSVCCIEITLRPQELLMEGSTSVNARVVVNQRIDSMLNSFRKEHMAERRGAKSGVFETTLRIDKLSKDWRGVLRAHEIASKAIDILEQA